MTCNVEYLLDEVYEEFDRSYHKFPDFNSAHEGYAVIKEELDELWHEVKHNKDPEAYNRMRAEAIQVAAMAVKFLMFLERR